MAQKVFDEFKIKKSLILEWAKRVVKEEPTVPQVHPTTGTTRKIRNTVAMVLRRVIGYYHVKSVEELSHNDLVMELVDLYCDGVKGYANMTVKELIEEVWWCVVSPEFSSMYDQDEPTRADAENLLDELYGRTAC